MNKVLCILKANDVCECGIDIDTWMELDKYCRLLGFEAYFVSNRMISGCRYVFYESIDFLIQNLSMFSIIITNSEFEFNDLLIDSGRDIYCLFKTATDISKYQRPNVHEMVCDENVVEKILSHINVELYAFWREYGIKVESTIDTIIKSYDVFLFDTGLGDTALFLSLFYQFKKENNKPICILTKNVQLKMLLEHCNVIDQVVIIPNELFDFCMNDFWRMKKIGIHNVVNMYYELDTVIQEEQPSFKGIICKFLGISESTPFEKWRYQCDGELGNEEFDKAGFIDGKTVLIIPFAKTFGNQFVSISFWEKLVKTLQNKGYQVVINAKEHVLDGVPNVFLDVESTIRFAMRCGNIISVRTGLSDLIAMYTDVYVQSLYPVKDSDIWDHILYKNADIYLEKASIENTFEPQKVTELFVENEEETLIQLVENIVKVG